MSNGDQNDMAKASLRMPVLRAFMTAILMVIAYGLLFWRWDDASGIVGLITLLGGLSYLAFLAWICALPSGLLFWAFLRLGERLSLRSPSLGVWLAAGMGAAAPLAWLVWTVGSSEYLSRPNPPTPYAWSNLQFPLFVLACGLAGAFAAWRTRRAMLAT